MTAQELRRCRGGLSKTRFAAILGVTRFHLANLEAGRRRVTGWIAALAIAMKETGHERDHYPDSKSRV